MPVCALIFCGGNDMAALLDEVYENSSYGECQWYRLGCAYKA